MARRTKARRTKQRLFHAFHRVSVVILSIVAVVERTTDLRSLVNPVEGHKLQLQSSRYHNNPTNTYQIVASNHKNNKVNTDSYPNPNHNEKHGANGNANANKLTVPNGSKVPTSSTDNHHHSHNHNHNGNTGNSALNGSHKLKPEAPNQPQNRPRALLAKIPSGPELLQNLNRADPPISPLIAKKPPRRRKRKPNEGQDHIQNQGDKSKIKGEVQKNTETNQQNENKKESDGWIYYFDDSLRFGVELDGGPNGTGTNGAHGGGENCDSSRSKSLNPQAQSWQERNRRIGTLYQSRRKVRPVTGRALDDIAKQNLRQAQRERRTNRLKQEVGELLGVDFPEQNFWSAMNQPYPNQVHPDELNLISNVKPRIIIVSDTVGVGVIVTPIYHITMIQKYTSRGLLLGLSLKYY
jgi:hypothetical protein